MRVDHWLRYAEARLQAAGIASPRTEAQVLAGHVLRVNRAWLLTHPEHDFPDLAGEVLLQRRERQEPLAYIVGTREFYGRTFRVTPAVLIPRHETETLVELALLTTAESCLDVGTGSGVLAVTLKLERPQWHVTGLDISAAALEVAANNAEQLGADVRFVLSDVFSVLEDERFDLIVSNPPYIGRSEPLDSEVRDYEPSLALFGGETGLEFYHRLAAEAPAFLSERGLLLMEVGYRQGDVVAELFHAAGWLNVRTEPDLSGTPRVVLASR